MTHDLEAEGFVRVRSLVREPDRRALLQVHDGGGRCESRLHASVLPPLNLEPDHRRCQTCLEATRSQVRLQHNDPCLSTSDSSRLSFGIMTKPLPSMSARSASCWSRTPNFRSQASAGSVRRRPLFVPSLASSARENTRCQFQKPLNVGGLTPRSPRVAGRGRWASAVSG